MTDESADRDAPLAQVLALSHVYIDVADLARSVAFYRHTLGLQVIVDGSHDPVQPNIKGLIGTFALEMAQLAPSADRATLPERRRALPPVALSFGIADLPEVFARFQAEGLTLSDAFGELQGSRFFSFYDPDGHLIELVEMPQGAVTLSALLLPHAAPAAKHAIAGSDGQ